MNKGFKTVNKLVLNVIDLVKVFLLVIELSSLYTPTVLVCIDLSRYCEDLILVYNTGESTYVERNKLCKVITKENVGRNKPC